MTSSSTASTQSHPRPWLVAASALAAFLFTDTVGLTLFRLVAKDWTGWPRIGALAALGYGLYLLAPLALAAALFGARRAFSALGLNRSILTGLAVGAAGTSLSLIGFALTTPLASGDLVLEGMRGALLPGVAEELLYRALLFGFLFRFAGWGFLPSALVGAVFFGSAHLYQGADALESLAIFAITGFGAIWFGWLYAEWRFNIWIPASFHVLMNLYWILFDVSDTALGSAWPNVLRVTTILLSIVITLAFAKRNGGRTVRGRAWFWGRPAPLLGEAG